MKNDTSTWTWTGYLYLSNGEIRVEGGDGVLDSSLLIEQRISPERQRLLMFKAYDSSHKQRIDDRS